MKELRSNTEWKLWGRDDPFWGVASWPGKERGGTAPWTDEEFYAFGQKDWRDYERQWAQYGLDRHSVLEIGCGAGRITKQLALAFGKVHAVDVSPDMIRRAQGAVPGNHVEFIVTDGLTLPLPNDVVSAIFSSHVLQHLDSHGVARLYLREIFRVLAPAGTVMLHLPVYEFPYHRGIRALMMRGLHGGFTIVSHLRAELSRYLRLKSMRGTAYPLTTMTDFLAALGFGDIEVRIFATESNGYRHTFVFGRKPGVS